MKKINITEHNVGEYIAKEIEGSATQVELTALNKWINQSDSNKRFYDKMKRVDELYTSTFSGKVDTQQAWANVQRKMHKVEASEPKKYFSLRSILGYVAAMAVLIFASTFLFQQDTVLPKLMTTNDGLTVPLEDGSSVELAKNSALSQLEEGERRYSFSGKGRFNVIHDEARPFQVYMNEVRVKDLGTVFDIEAQPENDTVFVKVDEGLVQFFTISNSGLILKEGEEGMFVKSTNMFYKRSIDPNKAVFDVSFDGARLGEVFDHLSYAFRKQVLVPNERVKNCNITVDFSDASFEVVKEIIEETSSLELTENENGLLVQGEGCE